MAFYALGLLLGRTGQEKPQAGISRPRIPGRKAKGVPPDPRSDLDFINAASPNPQSPSGTVAAEGSSGLANPSQRAAGETFYVQVGTFDRKLEARKLSETLAREGFSVRILSPSDSPGDSQFLAMVGPYSNRTEAEESARRLGTIGFSGAVKSSATVR